MEIVNSSSSSIIIILKKKKKNNSINPAIKFAFNFRQFDNKCVVGSSVGYGFCSKFFFMI